MTDGEIWINYSNGEDKKQSIAQCRVFRQNTGKLKKLFVVES